MKLKSSDASVLATCRLGRLSISQIGLEAEYCITVTKFTQTMCIWDFCRWGDFHLQSPHQIITHNFVQVPSGILKICKECSQAHNLSFNCTVCVITMVSFQKEVSLTCILPYRSHVAAISRDQDQLQRSLAALNKDLEGYRYTIYSAVGLQSNAHR